MSDRSAERAVISILVPIVVARAIYLMNEEDAQKWLQSLKNIPQWAQTKGLFNIAWITTYAASGFAVSLVYNASVEKHVTQNPALLAYAGQLGLCWLYTIVIYGLQSLDLGLAVLLLLDGFALLTTVSFLKVSSVAALLNLPIVLWLLLVTSLLFRCRSSKSKAIVGDDDLSVTKNPALISYAGQLGLCWLYTVVTYGLQSLDLGLAVLLLLDGLALLTTISFTKINTGAALLNLPIIGWLLLLTTLLFRCRESNSDTVGVVDKFFDDDNMTFVEKIF